jgi:hypothetical protein
MTWSPNPTLPPATITFPVPFTPVALNSNSDATGNASISSTEIDYFKFQATSTGPYVLSAKTPSSNLNPFLAVYSATGTRLAFNDDISSTNKDSQTAVNLQAGLTYYLGVTNRYASSQGSYTWKIDGLWGTAPDDSYEQNDSFAAAADLGTLNEFTTVENLVMRDSSDWYKFTTINTGKSTHYVGLEFEHRRGDLDMALYNDLGELIGRSRSRENEESVSLKGLAAGTYYVRVYGAQGAYSPQYNFVVRPPLVAPVLPPPQTDLVGNAIKITDDVNWDEYISIQTSIRNDGYTASGAFDVSWYLSKDNVVSPDDMVLPRTNGQGTKYRVAGIPANGVTPQISVNLQLPDDASVPTSWADRNALLYVIQRIDVSGGLGGEILETYPNGNPAEDNNFGEVGPSDDHVPLALGRKGKEPEVYNIDFNFSGISVSQQTIMKAAAHRWEQIILGDIADVAAQNSVGSFQIIDDLLLFAQSIPGDGPGGNLGAAAPLQGGQRPDGIPFASFFNIDRTDMNIMEQQNQLYKFSIHAIGRALGLGTSAAWQQWLVQDTMTNVIYFAGPSATAAYNSIFAPNGFGVLVNQANPTYWNEGEFGDEMLTQGNYGPMDLAPISIVTVGSLADMGYAVNPMMADDYMGTPMPAPASSSSFAPLPGTAPVGSSSSSPKSSATSSSAKSTIPGNPIDIGNPTDPVDIVFSEIDYEHLARVQSGIYDFDYWRLDAPPG